MDGDNPERTTQLHAVVPELGAEPVEKLVIRLTTTCRYGDFRIDRGCFCQDEMITSNG